MTKSILILVRAYLPSYKSGGPVRTISGLVSLLGKEFQFRIVTRDRDAGDAAPFPTIRANMWCVVGNACVNYRSPDGLGWCRLLSLLRVSQYDVIYLNSFFDWDFAIKPFVLWRLRLIRNVPLIIAPRGEFSPGALRIKRLKKWLFIRLFRLILGNRSLAWQASSPGEAEEIRAVIGGPDRLRGRIVVAANLADVQPLDDRQVVPKGSVLRVAFLSRLSRKKNLDFAIKVLSCVRRDVHFHVYGPTPRAEDVDYLSRCEELARNLPANVQYQYCGDVKNENVVRVLAGYDLFFLPTWGENYGHVIREALTAGLPVLISDRTPWRGLEQLGIGWDLPLEDSDAFVRVIEHVSRMSSECHASFRDRCRRYAMDCTNSAEVVEANRRLFERVAAREYRI